MDFTNSDSHAYPDVEGARDRSTYEPSTRNTAKGSIDPDVPSQKAPGRGFFDLAYELRKEVSEACETCIVQSPTPVMVDLQLPLATSNTVQECVSTTCHRFN